MRGCEGMGGEGRGGDVRGWEGMGGGRGVEEGGVAKLSFHFSNCLGGAR